jgi:hypothetical protein
MPDNRPDIVIAWYGRHAYTQTLWSDTGSIVHVWDVAEQGQHLMNSGCACDPIVWAQEVGVSVLHEFDPTAVASLLTRAEVAIDAVPWLD